MAKERHQIKSECPECGCGLIKNMTPDEFREKNSDLKDKDKGHDGCVTEKHTAVQNGKS